MEEDSVLSPEVVEYLQRDFDEDTYWNKQERIARKVMLELVKAGRSEFLLLRDDEVSQWWGKIVGSIQSKIAKHKEKVRIYELKLQAYERLTVAERKMLCIRKPTKPKGY